MNESSEPYDTDVVFSFLVPVHNEQDRLEAFYGQLTAQARELGEPYELLFINDGSTDGTEAILRRLARDDPCVRVLEFSREFGPDAAVTAGYDHAAGRAVVSIHLDRNHPLELISPMVARWREGFEVVYPVDRPNGEAPARRRWIRDVCDRVLSLVQGLRPAEHADFRLLDQAAVRAVRATREHCRSLRGLVHWIGFRQTTIPFPPELLAGASAARLGPAGRAHMLLRPVHLMIGAGLILLAIALLYSLVSLVLWPLGLAPSGLVHLTFGMLALLGLQSVMFGLIGQAVGRILQEARGRPLYVIRQTLGLARPRRSQPQEPAAPAPRGDSREDGGFSVYT